tara:strand:- start:187 stop:681 length:495 start_codon:yes stop_codon:yes gene_type:complete
MERGSGNKIKRKYTSPIKNKMGKTSLFNPTLYQKGLRAQYLSPRTGKVMTPKQMGAEFDRRQSGGDLMANLKSKDSFLGVDKKQGGKLGKTIVGKSKKSTTDSNNQNTAQRKNVDPELLLAMTMPVSYAIGKGIKSLFGRGKRKRQEIAEKGAQQEQKLKNKTT